VFVGGGACGGTR